MSAKIILHGMHRSPNFGDVLLTEILRDRLDTIPEVKIALLAPADSVRTLLGKPKAGIRDFLAADGVILGGGGFFQRMDGSRGSLKALIKYAFPLFLARMLGKPSAIIGAGADHMPRRWLDAMFGIFVGGTDEIAVRDQRSYDYLRTITRRNAHNPIERVSDLVFAINEGWLEIEALAWARGIVRDLGAKRVLAIHMSEAPSRNPVYERVAVLLEEVLAKQPETGILLIEDHPSGPNHQAAAQAELCERLPNRNIASVPYEGVQRLAALLASVDGVLTSKLHVALCAATMGTPPFAIAKHRKNAASFADLGIANQCCSLSDDVATMSAVICKFANVCTRFEVSAEVRERAQTALSIAERFVRRVDNGSG